MNKKDIFSSSNSVSRETKHIVFLITYSIVLAVALFNMNTTMSLLEWVLALLNPFLTGLIVAFIINIIMARLETTVFGFLNKPKFKMWQKIKRPVCMILSFLLVIVVIAGVVFFVAPELSQSVELLSSNMPIYISYLQRFTNNLLARFNITPNDFGNFNLNWEDMFDKISSLLADVSPGVLNFATNFTSAIFNFFMGLIFAIYMLISKEKLLLNAKRILYAYASEEKADTLVNVGSKANAIFTAFVVGQLTEAIILGVMYFIGTSIFRMPYAPLIAILMAVSSLIPMFGPIIGAIPSAFILLMVNPSFAIIFVIMAVVFQQIEGNFIYPRVVGSSIGLPGIWVLFAILIGGSLFGAIGMVIAVPITSLIYTLVRESVYHRLEEKNIRFDNDK